MQQIRILNPENFDIYLKLGSLINNIHHLADFLKNQKNLKHVDEITKTMSFIIDAEKLICTKKELLQIELSFCFLYYFRMIGPTHELNDKINKYLYRVFNLICIVLKPLRRSINDDEQTNDSSSNYNTINYFDERKNILLLCDQIDFFTKINDSCSFQTIFNTLIKIDMPNATYCLVKLVNNSIFINSIKRIVFISIYDALGLDDKYSSETRNRLIENFIYQLNETNRIEIIQNLRGILQGQKVYSIYKRLISILLIDSLSIINFTEFDYNNEDDQIRTESLSLAEQAYNELEFSIKLRDKYKMMLERHSDRSPKIRLIIIKFSFNLIIKIKKMNLSLHKNIDYDIFESVTKEIEDQFWNSILKERIIDKSNDVRMYIIDELAKVDSKYINQDFLHLISFRLRDKCANIRIACLNLMIKINTDQPGILDWLIYELIDLFPTIRDISLYGFSIFIQNRSIIEIARNIGDRKNLLAILDLITHFRKYLQCYARNDYSKEIENELEKYCKIQIINQIIKAVPKNFYQKALRNDSKYRHKLYQNLNEKMKEENALRIMGLYQPSPIEPIDLISQNDTNNLLDEEDFQIIKELSKIYSGELVYEIPTLILNLNKTNLIILASLEKEDELIDSKQRKIILKAILPLISTSNQESDNIRELAQKAFAKLIRKDQSNLIRSIKFNSNEFSQKLLFFAHFTDHSLIPSYFYNEIEENLSKIKTEKQVKYVLHISSNENSMRSVKIHQHFINDFPDLSFDSFINNCALKNNSFVLEPKVFRIFASLIQHENFDIREKVIDSLSNALKKFNTPIQFICYFVLSATDPYEPNRLKAKQEFESAVLWRRELVHHYLNKNSTNKKISQNQNPKPRRAKNLYDSLNDEEKKELLLSIPKNINIETTIPFMINILTHHFDFDADLPELQTFSQYLKFFFEPICNKGANISRLLDILFSLQMLQDCDDNDDRNLKFTEKMVLLCELASNILKEIGAGCEWGPNMEETFEFSTRYYKSTNSKERLRKILNKKTFEQFLIQNDGEKKMLRAGMSVRSTRIGRNQNRLNMITFYQSDEADSESDLFNQAPTSKRIRAPLSPTFVGKILSID